MYLPAGRQEERKEALRLKWLKESEKLRSESAIVAPGRPLRLVQREREEQHE